MSATDGSGNKLTGSATDGTSWESTSGVSGTLVLSYSTTSDIYITSIKVLGTTEKKFGVSFSSSALAWYVGSGKMPTAPTLTVTKGGVTAAESTYSVAYSGGQDNLVTVGTDGTLTFAENASVTEATDVTITATVTPTESETEYKGNSASYTITATPQQVLTVTYSNVSCNINGNVDVPTPTVKAGETELTEDELSDLTFTYSIAENSAATISGTTITGGSSAGTATVSVKVTSTSGKYKDYTSESAFTVTVTKVKTTPELEFQLGGNAVSNINCYGGYVPTASPKLVSKTDGYSLDGRTVTYTVDKSDYLTLDSDGNITKVVYNSKSTSITVTASIDGDGDYNAATATYKVTIGNESDLRVVC